MKTVGVEYDLVNNEGGRNGKLRGGGGVVLPLCLARGELTSCSVTPLALSEGMLTPAPISRAAK
jgi:hypothetical protein